jgi:hypothetical protein
MSFNYPTLVTGEVMVGFSTARHWNPLSALIRWLTKAKCSHTWLLYDDVDLRMLMVMEAHITFQLVPYETWLRDNRVIALVHTGIDLNVGLRSLAMRLGSIYDVSGLFGILPVKFGRWLQHHFHRLHLKIRNPWNAGRSLFCSEAVTLALHASGYPGSWQLDAGSTSPQDLLDFFLQNNVRTEVP